MKYNYLKYLDGRKVKDLNNRFKELFFKLFSQFISVPFDNVIPSLDISLINCTIPSVEFGKFIIKSIAILLILFPYFSLIKNCYYVNIIIRQFSRNYLENNCNFVIYCLTIHF